MAVREDLKFDSNKKMQIILCHENRTGIQWDAVLHSVHWEKGE